MTKFLRRIALVICEFIGAFHNPNWNKDTQRQLAISNFIDGFNSRS